MKKLNDIKQNINKKKITVLGGGVSGIGAATLANFLGAKVLHDCIRSIRSRFEMCSLDFGVETFQLCCQDMG